MQRPASASMLPAGSGGADMNVVAFKSAHGRPDDAVAAEIIDALGVEAELRLRELATGVADRATRERLGRIADVIAERQGLHLDRLEFT